MCVCVCALCEWYVVCCVNALHFMTIFFIYCMYIYMYICVLKFMCILTFVICQSFGKLINAMMI